MVTGAGGLIGSHLIRNMDKGWLSYGVSRSRPDGLDVDHHLPVDFSGDWSTDALPERIDAVVHLAQSEHFRDLPDRAEDVFRVNTASTVRLLDYARRAGARTFVLASSGGIYGFGDEAFSEEAQVPLGGETSFYVGTRLCSEVLAKSYASLMDVVVLRFFFVYGPGQRETMLIPRLVRSVVDGKPITLQGADGIRINPTYVDDAVAVIKSSLEVSASRTINVGGPEVSSLREIGEAIGRAVGKSPVFNVQEDVAPRHLIGDVGRMTELLGGPGVRFEDGIRYYLRGEA